MLNSIKDIIKNKIRWKIIRLLIPALLTFFLVMFILSLPLILVEEVKDMFNDWIDGKEDMYDSSGQAIDAWIDSLDGGLQIGEGYLTKAMLKSMRKYENESVIGDRTITLKKRINKEIYDERKPDKEYSYDDTVSYDLLLAKQTGEYKLPWQVLAAKNVLLMGDEQPNDTTLIDTMNNMFKTQYYGLFAGDDSGPVNTKSITSRADYRFIKKVKKETTVNSEYYVTGYDTDEAGNITEVKEGPFKRTTITTEYIEYPLPYFTSIQTMFETYDFEYEEKTTVSRTHRKTDSRETTVITTTTEPKLKDKNVTLDTIRYITNLKAIGISPDPDVVYIKDMLAILPYGDTLASKYDPVLTSISNMKGFDMYYGAESGYGQYKLSGDGSMIWPVDFDIKVSSGFGMRFHPVLLTYKFHSGIDIPSPQATRVFAAADGVVKSAGIAGSYGNLVVLTHDDGISSYYAHLSNVRVSAREQVRQGQLIAYSGGALGTYGSGRSTGAHLHFETRLFGNPVDPAELLGLVPDIPDTLPEELKYSDVNVSELQEWLDKRDSLLSEEPYLSAIIDAAEYYDVNPLLMFAITGQEQSFVKRSGKNAERIANNPFNVYHSWYEYNTTIYDTSKIAAKTIVNLSKGRPEGVNPIYWINTRGGKGGYAEDQNWWLGVSRFMSRLKSDVGYK